MHFEDGREEELVAFVTGDACMQRRCCPSLALRRRRSQWMDVDMVGNQSSRYKGRAQYTGNKERERE